MLGHNSNKMAKIDPLNFSQLADIVLKKETRKRWTHFLEFSHISELRQPIEEDFMKHFENRRPNWSISTQGL